MRYGLIDSRVCSRSQGQPPGARSRSMMRTSSAKASAAPMRVLASAPSRASQRNRCGTPSAGQTPLRASCAPVSVAGMAKIVMYTTQYCPYCVQAKALLRHKGVPFEEVDVGADADLREKMVEASGRRTVPQIFVNDQPIGGYEELRALDEQGELDRLLAA